MIWRWYIGTVWPLRHCAATEVSYWTNVISATWTSGRECRVYIYQKRSTDKSLNSRITETFNHRHRQAVEMWLKWPRICGQVSSRVTNPAPHLQSDKIQGAPMNFKLPVDLDRLDLIWRYRCAARGPPRTSLSLSWTCANMLLAVET